MSGPEKPAVVTTQEDDSGSRVVTSRYGPETRFRGKGFFNFDFLLYGAIGVDLQGLSREAVEALRLPLKVMVPFLVMIIASLLTTSNSDEALNRYYAKMKTPVDPDPEKDQAKLAAAYADPGNTERVKLFPNSNLEFQKPTVADITGFVISVITCFAIIGFAFWMAGIGVG